MTSKPFQLYWDTHWQCPIMFDGIEWWIWESVIEEWCWVAIYGRTPDLDTRCVLLFEIEQ